MLGRSIVQGACISRRGLLRVFAATGCVTLAGCGDVDPSQPESPVLAVSYEPPVGQAVPAQVPLPLNVFSFAGGGNSEGVSGIGLASGVRFPDIGGLFSSLDTSTLIDPLSLKATRCPFRVIPTILLAFSHSIMISSPSTFMVLITTPVEQ